MAQKLKVDVKLCAQMTHGEARYDICVRNIGNAVDSENAFCSWEPDKVSIHEAIQKNAPQDGFNNINKAVERIRLDYLLKHKVLDPEYRINMYLEDMVDDYLLRYKTILAPLFIIAIVSYLAIQLPLFLTGVGTYPIVYHFGLLVLPLFGLIFDIIVRFFGNKALLSKWMTLLGTIYAKWDYFVDKLGKDERDDTRDNVESLVDAIIVAVERIYFIGDDVPSFKHYCESSKIWSFVYECAPIFVFLCWTKKVERLIQRRHGRVAENKAVNESTPSNIL